MTSNNEREKSNAKKETLGNIATLWRKRYNPSHTNSSRGNILLPYEYKKDQFPYEDVQKPLCHKFG
jgi:hypothetical protein